MAWNGAYIPSQQWPTSHIWRKEQNSILVECIEEVKLISTMITNSQSWFIIILDLISDDNLSADEQELWKSKWSAFASVFRWLLGGICSTDENVQWLKDNVDILMSNQQLQQQMIKEIFKLSNLTRIGAFLNRKVLRQLDSKLIQLNHSLHTLEFHISRLQVDRIFAMSILQIHSHMSMLLVGII